MAGTKCSQCGAGMDPTHELWVFRLFFFCSEDCAVKWARVNAT